MRTFVNPLLRENQQEGERGFTLIELIAALSLVTVVLTAIYASITFGMNAYNRIKTENNLRDEGDLIMSSILTELYTFGPNSITLQPSGGGLELSRQSLTNASDIQTASIGLGTPTGGTRSQLLINGNAVQTNSEVVLSQVAGADSSSISLSGCKTTGTACTNGLINIHLNLQQSYAGHNYNLQVDSSFGF